MIWLIVLLNFVITVALVVKNINPSFYLNPINGSVYLLFATIIFGIQALILGRDNTIFALLVFLSFLYLLFCLGFFIYGKLKKIKISFSSYEKFNLGTIFITAGLLLIVLMMFMELRILTFKALIFPELCIIVGQLILITNWYSTKKEKVK